MKGIILAGGTGTRLYPATLAVNKQLLPVYDKPMIYYPLSTLMLAQIRDILIISSPEHIEAYRGLFGNGSNLGLTISYAVQEQPDGIAQAFTIGADFIGDSPVALILGDNILVGAGLRELLTRATRRPSGATVFACQVEDPERYGVVEFDPSGRAVSIEEKPKEPRSQFAVTGFYFYDSRVVSFARSLTPSGRGELEITDINRLYMEAGELTVEVLSRGFAWLDAGTHDSLLEASEFVRVLQKRQGIQVACLEEIAFKYGYITREQLSALSERMPPSPYRSYLLALARGSGFR